MFYKELITQISEELSLQKQTVKKVLDSYLGVIKNSIESEEDDKIVFRSPILGIRTKIISKNEEKNRYFLAKIT